MLLFPITEWLWHWFSWETSLWDNEEIWIRSLFAALFIKARMLRLLLDWNLKYVADNAWRSTSTFRTYDSVFLYLNSLFIVKDSPPSLLILAMFSEHFWNYIILQYNFFIADSLELRLFLNTYSIFFDDCVHIDVRYITHEFKHHIMGDLIIYYLIWSDGVMLE